MKQVLQSLATGRVSAEEVPPPSVKEGCLLVCARASALSIGTERSTIERVRSGVLGEAKRKPELVRELASKLMAEGLGPTFEKVISRLEEPIPLGYSLAGVVEQVGPGVEGFKPGDAVACAGYGYASHAQTVCVPKNLCVKIPQGVSWEEACFTTLGAIALQAVRTAQVQVGESVAVLGLGMIGQLIVQILHASGCRVFAVDPRQDRKSLAQELGAEAGSSETDLEQLSLDAKGFTAGRGFDAVILAASGDQGEPLTTAAQLARERGVIVMVGDVPLQAPRNLFYEKELSLRMARSYGPGRGDQAYEVHGIDYPVSYVRWTAQRNMEAYLHLAAGSQVRVSPLISHRFQIGQAEQAYALITQSPSCLGVLFTYDHRVESSEALPDGPENKKTSPTLPAPGKVGLGVIGAGRFARSELLPRLRKLPEAQLLGVATSHGTTARQTARRFGFALSTTDYKELFAQPGLQAVVIATPHHLHAEMVLEALKAGRHVFVEKPLCLNAQELEQISKLYNSLARRPILCVGFNRRFSWVAEPIKKHFEKRQGPLTLLYRVNAGPAPKTGWLSDNALSGGRFLGEVGHFVDLACHLIGSAPTQLFCAGPNSSHNQPQAETATLLLSFQDGSQASIAYVTGSDRRCPKERIDLFGQDRAVVMEDFRKIELFHRGSKSVKRRIFQDKGIHAELAAFLKAVRMNGPSPISFEAISAATWIPLKAMESLRTGRPISLDKLTA